MPSTATSRIDGLSTSVAVKAPVHAVATSNITLSGLQTVGGVVLDGDDLYRVLCIGQTAPADNGIWDASTGTWTRAKDFDGNRDVVHGTLVPKSTGSGGAFYRVTTTNPIVIGTSEIEFESVSETGIPSTGIVYDITPAETAEGVTPTDYSVPSDEAVAGDFRRNGADGTATNDTAAFLASCSSGLCYIPEGTWLIEGPFYVPSNCRIICHPRAVIRVPAGGIASDIGWIRFRDVDNIRLEGNGSTWEFTTKPSADEQRHIFDIRGGSNIYIGYTNANKAGGDGYYVGKGAVALYSENITLDHVNADDCRRQGLSVVSVIGLDVLYPQFNNITGTSPQAGIDIESNVSTDELKSIRIVSPRTANCSGAGIAANINDLPAGYELDIVITDHVDDGSLYGFIPQRGTPMVGRFDYINGCSRDAGDTGIAVRSWQSTSTLLRIIDPVIINPNANDLSGVSYSGHGISVFNPGSDGNLDIGNVLIVRPRVVDNRGTALMKDCIYGRNIEATGVVSKIRVLDPQELSGNTANKIGIRFGGTSYLRDPLYLTKTDLTASADYGASAHASLVTNAGASGSVTVTLKDTMLANDTETTFRVDAAQTFILDPEATSTILWDGAIQGATIRANRIGAWITLRRTSATIWQVVGGGDGWNTGAFISFTADDATPSVRAGYHFVTANSNPTTITAFDDGHAGQTIVVEIDDANTTIDFSGTTLKGNGGSDWSPANGDMLRATFNGTNWLCSINDCTP